MGHDIGRIRPHNLVCLIVQEDKVGIREAAQNKPGKLANKVTEYIPCDSEFLDLMKTMLSVSIAFER